MSQVPQVLNLLSLAKTADGGHDVVPGTDFEISLMKDQYQDTVEADVWILVLKGELIVDLPYGDFRILKTGESVHLPEGLKVSYQPLQDTIALWKRD